MALCFLTIQFYAMFKLLSFLLTSLTIGSILASPAPAPQTSPSCISCPFFIPACRVLCPAGDDCKIIPRTCHKCEQIKCVPAY
ncbi:hypothetical protein FB451DRAFT_1266984 [Mycena latifolia]|nr:hypothetical protein FB451DRAFT_1266984 [Mycena latifolia]